MIILVDGGDTGSTAPGSLRWFLERDRAQSTYAVPSWLFNFQVTHTEYGEAWTENGVFEKHLNEAQPPRLPVSVCVVPKYRTDGETCRYRSAHRSRYLRASVSGIDSSNSEHVLAFLPTWLWPPRSQRRHVWSTARKAVEEITPASTIQAPVLEESLTLSSRSSISNPR